MNDSKAKPSCQTVVLYAVYVLWCRVTNQCYVGVTRCKVEHRISQHKRGKLQFVDTEIQRIGWEGHWDWWVVEDGIPAELISDCEQRWVKFFDCVYPKGYNKTCGGIGNFTVSDDTRNKRRQVNHKGENNPFYGKHHTEKSKEKSRQSNRGRKHTEEEKAKMRGRHQTEETKAKIGKGNRGKKRTEEQKEHYRQAHLGKPLSEERKSKMRGKKRSEETKAIMSAKALARGAAKRAVKAAEAAEAAVAKAAEAAAEAQSKAEAAKAVVEAIEAAKKAANQSATP